jgi:DNA-binding NarL/FixJ family response regulator
MITEKQLEKACELYSKEGPGLRSLYLGLIQYVYHVKRMAKVENAKNSAAKRIHRKTIQKSKMREYRNHILNLRMQGLSIRAIGRELNISTGVVQRALKLK